jgi:glycosyltransferase involved in cell wall biosynthesis
MLAGGAVKASVLLMTYNHGAFVQKAVESAVFQEAPFPFEVVVGDDCSTDSTPESLRSLAGRFPGLITLVMGDRNRGMWANFGRTLAQCRGEYVAFLEGDDYWTSRHKLAKQVALLDSKPELALCFHAAVATLDDGRCEVRRHEARCVGLPDLLVRNFMMTATVMVRRAALRDLPDWLGRVEMLDWPLFVLCARHGGIAYIDEAMSVYRIHSGGAWSSRSKVAQLRAGLDVYRFLAPELHADLGGAVRSGMSRRLFDLSWALAEEGRRAEALARVFECIRVSPRDRLVPVRELAKLALFLLWPTAYTHLDGALRARRAATR